MAFAQKKVWQIAQEGEKQSRQERLLRAELSGIKEWRGFPQKQVAEEGEKGEGQSMLETKESRHHAGTPSWLLPSAINTLNDIVQVLPEPPPSVPSRQCAEAAPCCLPAHSWPAAAQPWPWSGPSRHPRAWRRWGQQACRMLHNPGNSKRSSVMSVWAATKAQLESYAANESRWPSFSFFYFFLTC